MLSDFLGNMFVESLSQQSSRSSSCVERCYSSSSDRLGFPTQILGGTDVGKDGLGGAGLVRGDLGSQVPTSHWPDSSCYSVSMVDSLMSAWFMRIS